MLFNSWDFVTFFLAVYATYLTLRDRRVQNVLLLVASYYFYCAWDWRFASLIVISTLVDFFAGARIAASGDPRRRRFFLCLSMVTNLGLLGFFKYFGFFVSSMEGLLASFGIDPGSLRLDIVLPVGISFYTFQTMSYTIDIYRGELQPTRSLLDFSLFVAFFPQLVAGPIERARTLLPQIARPRTLHPENFTTGCWLIFFGMWKKIFIADNMAGIVEPIFAGSAEVTWLQAYLGVLAFAIQIYCDFSAYSDIARGLARIMGFELMRNFNLPYFALNPSDFWRRWHISLSTWLRDYLYIPVGGNRGGTLRTYRNLFITMGLGGLWHGASWNFLWWGLYHGALLAGHRLITLDRGVKGLLADRRGMKLLSGMVMFQFTLFGWLLFRSTRVVVVDGVRHDDSFNQIVEMMTSYANGWGFDAASGVLLLKLVGFGLPLLLIQVGQYRLHDHYFMLRWPRWGRCALVAFLAFTWVFFGVQIGEQFIYFQF